MRLWHPSLIEVLPRQQLLGQWRELNSIFVQENRHVLINFVYNYSKEHLYNYTVKVIWEMKNRNYKINLTKFWKYFENDKIDYMKPPFPEKMTRRYLRQCYYNLQEKYDCGAITPEEWGKIKSKYYDIMEKEEQA